MATHGEASASFIEEITGQSLVKKLEEIQTPIAVIGAQLLKSGLIPVNLVDEDNIEELNIFIQQMLDQGTMQIERHIEENKVVMINIVVSVKISITHLVIEFPAPFDYKSEKVVSWIYQPKSFKQGKEDQPVVINEPYVTSIVG